MSQLSESEWRALLQRHLPDATIEVQRVEYHEPYYEAAISFASPPPDVPEGRLPCRLYFPVRRHGFGMSTEEYARMLVEELWRDLRYRGSSEDAQAEGR